MGRTWRRRLDGVDDRVVALLVAVLPVVLVLLAVARVPQLSVYDEPTHLDYAWKVSQGELPATGDSLGPQALVAWSCRGQMPPVVPDVLPACGVVAPAEFPARGLQYNAFHPPVYYWITGTVARVADDVLPVGFVVAARAQGAAYLGTAVSLSYLVLRRWGLQRRTCVGTALAFGLYPGFLQLAGTVTNDAVAPLAGVAALVVLTRVFREERVGWVLPSVLTLLVASTKVVHAVGLLAVAVVVGLSALGLARREGWRAALPRARVAVGVAAAVAVVHLGWGAFQSGRADPDFVNPIARVNGTPVRGLPFSEWAPSLVSGFDLTAALIPPPELASRFVLAYVSVLTLVVASAWLLVLAVFDRGEPQRRLGAAVLVGGLLYPLLVQVQALGAQVYFPNVSSRYGSSLVLLALTCLAVVLERRRLLVPAALVLAYGVVVVVGAWTGVLMG